MKKTLYSAMGALSIISLLLAPCAVALAGNTVSATVSVKTISVSVTDGSVSYGVLAANGTKSTIDLSDPQTATNNGNVAIDLTISGANTSGCVWTLAGTQGADQYYHKVSTNTTDWTALTSGELALAYNLAAPGPATGTQAFDLEIGVPSSSTCSTTATSVVTVTAAEHS